MRTLAGDLRTLDTAGRRWRPGRSPVGSPAGGGPSWIRDLGGEGDESQDHATRGWGAQRIPGDHHQADTSAADLWGCRWPAVSRRGLAPGAYPRGVRP